jgi:hypothetical protein
MLNALYLVRTEIEVSGTNGMTVAGGGGIGEQSCNGSLPPA